MFNHRDVIYEMLCREEILLKRVETKCRDKGIDPEGVGTYFEDEVKAIKTRIKFYTMLCEETQDEKQERLREEKKLSDKLGVVINQLNLSPISGQAVTLNADGFHFKGPEGSVTIGVPNGNSIVEEQPKEK